MPAAGMCSGFMLKLVCNQVSLYRGAAAAVIVFDITSKDSFAKAKSWIKELQRQVSYLRLSSFSKFLPVAHC